ncbi:hypothetical protein ACFPIJ_62705 [Dactylosporangium cerinum]|uniref:Uncharacterized protein n=1 Tax=Dactylosporangium cerinum TaxID=1434730 RepID=A0ABV9WI49_9ACTN
MCIDGWQPEGIHPILGPVFVACEFALACTVCGGCSWFPTDRTALYLQVRRLEKAGYRMTCCLACLGITNIIPLKGGSR